MQRIWKWAPVTTHSPVLPKIDAIHLVNRTSKFTVPSGGQHSSQWSGTSPDSNLYITITCKTFQLPSTDRWRRRQTHRLPYNEIALKKKQKKNNLCRKCLQRLWFVWFHMFMDSKIDIEGEESKEHWGHPWSAHQMQQSLKQEVEEGSGAVEHCSQRASLDGRQDAMSLLTTSGVSWDPGTPRPPLY